MKIAKMRTEEQTGLCGFAIGSLSWWHPSPSLTRTAQFRFRLCFQRLSTSLNKQPREAAHSTIVQRRRCRSLSANSTHLGRSHAVCWNLCDLSEGVFSRSKLLRSERAQDIYSHAAYRNLAILDVSTFSLLDWKKGEFFHRPPKMPSFWTQN